MIAASILAAAPGQAQSVVIPPEASCARCTLTLTLGPRLGDSSGAAILDAEPSSVARDRAGRFFLVLFSAARGTVLVFDSSGRYLTDIGRKGSGPGEFSMARHVVIAPGDSIVVADFLSRRVSFFDLSLRFVRSFPSVSLGRAAGIEVLRDGSLAANTNITTRQAVGYPLHLHSAEGAVLRSFGADAPAFRVDRPLISRRRLARSRSGGFWAAHATRYTIEHYDERGDKLGELVRKVAWFPPHEGVPISVDAAPQPTVMGLHEDDRGRLWVLTVLPDPNWRSAVGNILPRTHGGGRSPIPVVQNYDAYYDSLIEVIDPTSGRLITAQRFPQALGFLVGSQFVAMRRESEAGDFFVQTWRVQFREP